MRPKSLALLLLALGCGLVASIGITQMLSSRNADSSAATGDTQPVYVAVNDVALGDLLTAQMLKLEQWPKGKVPAGAIARLEDAEGRRARTKLFAGEPILDHRLLGKGTSEQGATALIPKGYRVVPVKVDLVSGGSSLILPGDRVDVLVHLVKDMSRDIQETVTRTILQDIKVFAVDSVVDLEKEKEPGKTIAAKTISLLVTPEQAVKVMLASQLGTVNLVMRSPEDDQQGVAVQARPAELFGPTARSERGKENLLDDSDSNLTDKANGLLGFLNSMKGKKTPPATVAPAAAEASRETWSMRLLKAGTVDQVDFEAEPATAGSQALGGGWKITSSMPSGAGGNPPAPAAEEPKAAAAPSAAPPAKAGPATDKPARPTSPQKKGNPMSS
jgi:pilus assembly protein CpaB